MVEDAHLVHALVTPLGTDVTVPGEFGAAAGKRQGNQDGGQYGRSHPTMMKAGRTRDAGFRKPTRAPQPRCSGFRPTLLQPQNAGVQPKPDHECQLLYLVVRHRLLRLLHLDESGHQRPA